MSFARVLNLMTGAAASAVALLEAPAGACLGAIRGCKRVVIGQLLVLIIGVGALLSLFSQNLLMAHFWALIFIFLAFAVSLAEIVALLERRIVRCAGARA